jgi:putative ABC transport system permease protein
MTLGLFKIAIKTMLNKKKRTVFSILGIALGIALVASLIILFQRMDAGLAEQVKKRFGPADMMVGFRRTQELLTQEQINLIQMSPDVASSSKALVNPQNFSKDRAGTTETGIYYVAVDNGLLAKQTYRFKKDLKPQEVVINTKLALELNTQVSDWVNIPLPGGKGQKWKVAEIVEDPGGVAPNLAVFHLETMQQVLNLDNSVNMVMLKLKPGTDKIVLASKLKELLKGDLDIDTNEGMDAEKKNIQHLKVLSYALGFLSFLASCLLLLSNFQFSLNERVRDLAVLRTVGGSKVQLLSLVLMEAVVVGTIGILLGLVFGVVLAELSASIVEKLLVLSLAKVSLNWGLFAAVGSGGIIVILIVSLIPAWHTTRVLPIQAVRIRTDKDFQPVRRIPRSTKVAGILGIALLIIGRLLTEGTGQRVIFSVMGGVLLTVGLYSGTVFFSTLILRGFSRVVVKVRGRESFMAVKNLITEVKPTAITVMVLAVGITLAISVSSILLAVKNSSEENIRSEYVSDLVVSSQFQAQSKLPYSIKNEIQSIPGVRRVITVSNPLAGVLKDFDYSRSQNDWLESQSGFENGRPLREKLVYSFVDFEGLVDKGLVPPINFPLENIVVFPEKLAKGLGVNVGDRITTAVGNSDNVVLTVGATVKSIPGNLLQDQVLVSWKNEPLKTLADQRYSGGVMTFRIFIDIDGNQKEKALKAMDSLKSKYPELRWSDLAMAIAETQRMVYERLALLIAAIAVILLIGSLGMVNTLSANILSKQREYGILRAISLSPVQNMKVIFLQGFLVSINAIILGLITAGVMSLAFTQALATSLLIPRNFVLGIVVTEIVLTLLVVFPISYSFGSRPITCVLRTE